MDNNLTGYEEFSSTYIDDIIIFTKYNESDHLEKVYKILEKCKENLRFSIKPKEISNT